ncbi:MAG: hypothetical protein LLG93_14640, partial [Deltaproteobacteria bacterium]|nr:hypothetical protein [Deltaproteobacteria bacterium]
MGKALGHLKSAGIVFAAALVLTGCGSRAALFVVMPEADGRVGRIEVVTEKGSQVLDRPWQAVETTGIDRAPGEPKTLDERTVQAMFREALDARPDPPVTYRVFFRTGRTEMTAASDRTIQEVLE